MGFNITEIDEGKVFYYDVKKDTLKLWINTAIHLQNNNKEFAIEFMNKTMDMCKILVNRRYDPVMGIFFEILKEKIPFFPKRCPIEKVSSFIVNVFFFRPVRNYTCSLYVCLLKE